jgi:alpha-galactosidase
MPMKKILFSLLVFLACPVWSQNPESDKVMKIETGNSCLTLAVGADNYLYQLDYGKPGKEIIYPVNNMPREREFYPASGNGFITEPALEVNHADGNTSTDLFYQSHETEVMDANIVHTIIHLADPQYPFYVDIHIKAYKKEDVLEMWTEISHQENGAVTLYKYASISPVFSAKDYWLSQFCGDYMREATLTEEKLTAGIKVLDSKIGVRAHQMRNPSFILSLNQAADENNGEVYLSSLSWPGSFQLVFDLDWNNNLRALSGINPYAAKYTLEKGTKFKTPVSVWTYSASGKGQASRNMHKWAVNYTIRDGKKNRPVLLNNWEATYFDFSEKKIVSLFDHAKSMGVELFLLDDGWFGNGKFARNDDKHGLGDWTPNKAKLPSGISYLSKEADRRGIGFGIWIEPEMVNPQSELYEKHPDWVIAQPKRKLQYGRNQLILDLTYPEVRQYEWDEIINKTLEPNPGISYVKWDANRYVTQPGSNYLPAGKQSHLLIDYNRALLGLMRKTADNYPDVMMMLCSGGSGRTDYGSLRYFHSFWPSDNTDPLKRVYIQWGFSHIFPANTISAHVTNMGGRPMKFTIDVALSGAFGLDLDPEKLTADQATQIRAGVELYKRSIRAIVQYGDLYRLSSPYEQNCGSLSYVSEDKNKAVVFVYQVKDGQSGVIKLRGLDPVKKYRLKELNLEKGQKSLFDLDSKVMTGHELMNAGFTPVCKKELESMIIGLNLE